MIIHELVMNFPNFFLRIFQFFSNFFFQIFLSKFSSKLFRDLFRGVRARHTRVASTPRGIFLVIWMRKFFFPEFFPKFFSNFFFQIFLSKFSSKLFWDLFRGVRARHTRVASTPRGIFLLIIWMRKFFFPQFFSRFFPEKFMNYS